VVFLSRSVIEICWSYEVWLLYITMLIICFWWHLFIITPLLFLVCLLSCMHILLVSSQKFFEWETFPQIKFGDANLGVPVWFHSFNMACPGISVIYSIISVKRIKFFSIPFIPISAILHYLWKLSSAHLSSLCFFITLHMNFIVLFFLWRCSTNRL
jgi:hypothetical protein